MFVFGKVYIFSLGYCYIPHDGKNLLNQIAWVLMETRGFEPLTSAVRSQRSTS